jgi:hypothetical protein
MSEIRANSITDAAGTGAPNFPNGLESDGVSVATTADIPAAYTNADALSLFNASGSAPVYACRAWVNFNGTGTVAIRASGNVSSITDNGVGMYTVNFTTAMQDANYAWFGSSKTDGTGMRAVTLQNGFSSDQLAASLSIETIRDTASRVDAQLVTVAIFR